MNIPTFQSVFKIFKNRQTCWNCKVYPNGQKSIPTAEKGSNSRKYPNCQTYPTLLKNPKHEKYSNFQKYSYCQIISSMRMMGAYNLSRIDIQVEKKKWK